MLVTDIEDEMFHYYENFLTDCHQHDVFTKITEAYLKIILMTYIRKITNILKISPTSSNRQQL